MRSSLGIASATWFAVAWIGCTASTAPDAGPGTCGTNAEPCTTDLDCCSGFVCAAHACAFESGGIGGGSSSGTGSGSTGSSPGSSTGQGATSGGSSGSAASSTGGTGHASSTGETFGSSGGSSGGSSVGSTGASSGSSTSAGTSGGASAGGSTGGEGSSTGGSTGASTSGGTSGAGSSGGGSSGGTGTTYCDGLEVTSSGDNPVLLQTYVFSPQLTSDGCAAQLAADAVGASLSTVGGIYDLDAEDNGTPSPEGAIFPAGCDDLGLSAFARPDGGPGFTAPSGASTVAAALGQSGSLTVYGVVTAITPWSSASPGHSGSVYLQDPASGVPAPKSGVLVYFPIAGVPPYGNPPQRGDVVEVTNVTLTPYRGQNELLAAATSVVTLLGTSPLPAPISLGSLDVGPTPTANGQQYFGMRVTVNDGPFAVAASAASGNCPPAVEYTSTVP